MIRLVVRAAALLVLCNQVLAATGYVENPQPNSIQSGASLINGWTCGPAGLDEARRNGGLFIASIYDGPKALRLFAFLLFIPRIVLVDERLGGYGRRK